MARITVGVCGGIGAYKAAEVVRGLQQRGHDVTVVMTRNALRFVGELTFEEKNAISIRAQALGSLLKYVLGRHAKTNHPQKYQ